MTSQYEDYSPSKGIFEYYTGQLKQAELRNDQKDRELAHWKAQYVTQEKQLNILERESSKLHEENG